MRWLPFAVLIPVAAVAASGQARPQLSDTTRAYVAVDAAVVALTHVKVIDGTGPPPATDRTVVIANGRIQAVGPAGTMRVPPEARVLDLRGSTVVPGFAGMHNHIHYTTAAGRRAQPTPARRDSTWRVG